MRLEMFAKNRGNQVHEKLNLDAIVGIIKHVEETCEWEFDLAGKLNNAGPMRHKETRLIPLLKRTAAKYHEEHDKAKGEAMKEMKKENEAILKIRGKGQWTLAKQMGSKKLPPLNAVRRVEKRAQRGSHRHNCN